MVAESCPVAVALGRELLELLAHELQEAVDFVYRERELLSAGVSHDGQGETETDVLPLFQQDMHRVEEEAFGGIARVIQLVSVEE